MSLAERRQLFEAAIIELPEIRENVRIAKNFGFSNSARVIQGGLFAGTSNLEGYSKNLAEGTTPPLEQFVFLCVLTFPPQSEVYFAIVVETEVDRINNGLIKLYHEAVQRNIGRPKPSKINNNVKFYITGDGRISFHNNEFLETLQPETGAAALDEECMARIDSIIFAIWPPSVSASRSLLARNFVGYLGGLIGRERVHERQVWSDTESMRPTMCRMPSSIPIAEISAAVEALGGYYPNGEVQRLHAALNFLDHKHFVILSGLSGTGKTQLALKYARAVHGLTTNTESDSLIFECPVRPEWTDPSGLTGYYDVLTNRYVVPTFLKAVMEADARRESPVFVILDEMNLARVEYYLSDVLSCMETRGALQLHSNDVPMEGTTGIEINSEQPLPPNLFIIGTINVDETTNPVSDKVLDRASVIDMSAVNAPGFLASLEDRHPDLKAARAAGETKLIEIHGLMQQHGLGFGYRLIEEFVRYHAFDAKHLNSGSDEVTDQLLVQKVLVKLRGNERQRSLLTNLDKACQNLPRAQSYIQKLLSDLDDFGSFQAMR